jgi:ABC-type branched-subunit amino acid transport system ATPase component/ABC-type branched-subunit amino acid transport system permease subunit
MRIAAGRSAVPIAIVALTAAALLAAAKSDGYTPFVLALVALTAVVGVGLNILLGLTGQVSLGHVGFYAIGAYTVAILTLKGIDFWIALPLAGAVAGIVGFALALPALRVTGPYLAMVTIAFAFIIQHGTIEWRALTGGANGLMGIAPPSLGALVFSEREMAMLAVTLAGASLYAFHRLARSGWGMAMVAVRDAEPAARSIGLNPVIVRTAAFSLSAVFTGLAGGIFAPLLMFVAPDSFPFRNRSCSCSRSSSAAPDGPSARWWCSWGVALPGLLSSLAEHRLLFFGASLLVILWVAPAGVLGLLARLWRRTEPSLVAATAFDVAAFLAPKGAAGTLEVRDLGITFGGIKAASAISFTALPGKVTSVIGPNGAGKTTVLNLIGGFYRPDSGSIRLGERELAGSPAWKVARAGIARTYQTTKLFATMSIIDNVLIALRRGRLGSMAADAASPADRDAAEALLAFVGYHGSLSVPAGDLPHVDRRLVEIARALAMRPRVLLLDEPAAGLMRSDKDADRDGEIAALLERFPRLKERLTIRAGLLSGGEQQMLAIARGLMAKPRILLLDEPSLGLAPAMINELFDILAGLRDEGVTILLVDQMAALALTIADRGYVLELGKIVRSDNAVGLADDPELEAAYLGRTEAAQ